LSLGLLDMLMDKCATSFHKQIGTRDFMQVLIVILNNKQMQQEIQKKIVYLIQKWGLRFEKQNNKECPLFFEVYSALKKSGVQFPPPPANVQQPAPSKPSQSSSSSGASS